MTRHPPGGDSAAAGSLDLQLLARSFGDRHALRSPGGSVSYAELPRLVAAMAGWLGQQGVRQGDIVALTGTTADADRAALPLALLAATSLGAVAALPPARAPAARQAELLAALGPVQTAARAEMPISTEPCVPQLEAIPAPTQEELRRIAEGGEPSAPPPPLAPTLRASILFTSGSSGTPKAVVHTLGNHLASAAASAHRLPLTPQDSWLACLPLSHIGGLGILFRTLTAGACMELASAGRFTDPGRPEVAALRRCSHASLVDTQLRRLAALPMEVLSHRPRLLVGGSAVRRHLIEEVRQRGVPVHASYGSTEMCSQVATTDADAASSYAPDGATVAAEPLPGQVVRVADSGELLLRGPTLAAGYLHLGQLQPLTDNDGWYHSGDLGQLLTDGRLVVTGRSDAMFISGGENVQPEKIERVLLQHPAVLAACCVPRADEEFGARPVAFLQVEGGPLPPEGLERVAISHLTAFEMPAAYLPMPELGGGKPDRTALTRLAEREDR